MHAFITAQHGPHRSLFARHTMHHAAAQFKQQRRHASTIQQGSVRLAGAYDKRSGRRLSSLVSAASASVSVRY